MSDVVTPALAESTPRPMQIRLWVMMFLQYFVQGCYLPIISLYLQDALGFDSAKIGLFGSALAVGPLFAPFIIGQVVDRHVSTEYVLAFCHAAGGLVMLALFWLDDLSQWLGWGDPFWPVVALGTIYSTLYVPSMMLTNSLAFHHLKNRDREFPLVRLWGTIGFVVPAWLVEMVFLKGLEGDDLNQARGIVLALAGFGGLVMAGYSLSLPHTPPIKDASKDLAPGKILDLLKLRSFFVLVVVGLIIAVVHKFYFVWNSVFLRDVLDSGQIEGAYEQRISSLGQIFEVLVMAGLGLMISRLGFKWTMLIGTTAYFLRCLIFAGALAVDLPFPVVMSAVCIGQMLHGFCFGCFLAAAFMFVDRVSPVDVRGTMQNFYGTFVIGLGFFAGGFIAGQIGGIFTGSPGEGTMRERIGIGITAGLVKFQQEHEDGTSTELLRDWTGLWLTCGLLAVAAIVIFWMAFPRETQKPAGESA